MRSKLSALIIDRYKTQHDYTQVFMEDAPEWFETEYDLTVITDTKNILSELNKVRGVDAIITIGEDIDYEPLNQ
jgi:hypothetical protein